MMKKLLLVCAILFMGADFSQAAINNLDCSYLGYTQTSCPSGFTGLKCPFDLSKLLCVQPDCTGYPLTECYSSVGSCQKCPNGNYWRYTTCNGRSHLNAEKACVCNPVYNLMVTDSSVLSSCKKVDGDVVDCMDHYMGQVCINDSGGSAVEYTVGQLFKKNGATLIVAKVDGDEVWLIYKPSTLPLAMADTPQYSYLPSGYSSLNGMYVPSVYEGLGDGDSLSATKLLEGNARTFPNTPNAYGFIDHGLGCYDSSVFCQQWKIPSMYELEQILQNALIINSAVVAQSSSFAHNEGELPFPLPTSGTQCYWSTVAIQTSALVFGEVCAYQQDDHGQMMVVSSPTTSVATNTAKMIYLLRVNKSDIPTLSPYN